MLRACKPGNFPRIVETKAAACRNSDAVRSTGNETGEHRRTGDYVGSASRGENAMAASGNHILQSLSQIGCRIKRTVKGDFKRMGELDECASAFNIHGSAVKKHAENDTGRAHTANELDLLAHRGEGGGIVMKALSMGTHHHVNGNLAAVDGLLDEGMRWCEAIHFKRGAKFHSIGPALLCSQASFQSFGTQFE